MELDWCWFAYEARNGFGSESGMDWMYVGSAKGCTQIARGGEALVSTK